MRGDLSRGPTLAVLTCCVVAAGCLAGPAGDVTAPREPWVDQVSLAPGGLVEVAPDRVHWRWHGNASSVDGTGHSVARLAAPPGHAVTVQVNVTWQQNAADLDLEVRAGAGDVACLSVVSYPVVVSPRESCRFTPRNETHPDDYDVVVRPGLAEGLPVPFTVDVIVAAITRPGVDADVSTRFRPPVLIDRGADTEAALAIGSRGTILACTHGAFRGPSPAYVSTDGATSWQRLDVGAAPGETGDCDVAITDGGGWHVVYNGWSSGVAPMAASLASSFDEGATWTHAPIVAYPAGGSVDRPWLMADGDDLTLTYANTLSVAPALHWFTRSTDGGATWPLHTPAGTAEGDGRVQKVPGRHVHWANGQSIAVPIVATDDAHFTDARPASVLLHRSDDGGLTWRSEVVQELAAAPFSFANLARSPNGTLFVSYVEGVWQDLDLLVTWSHDEGKTWSQPVVVQDGMTRSVRGIAGAAIDAHPQGYASLAWLQDAPADGRRSGNQLWMARIDPAVNEPLQFRGGVTEPYDAPFIHEFIDIEHGPDGRAHILYVAQQDGCALRDGDSRQLECLYSISER